MSAATDSALLNSFAIRSFRDTADRDYVHARLAYRAQLVPQFLWSSLHCLEKYAKGTLVLNRIEARSARHTVTPLLKIFNDQAKFQIVLSSESRDFLERIETMAGYRYFESSYYNLRHDLVRLDRMVWELRRYCQPLDQTLKTGTGSIELLPMNLERLRQTSASKSKDTCIISGWLEGVIKKKKHPSREALLWNNLFFGPSRRKTVKLIAFSESGNSPLSMHPEVLEDAMRYVHIPHHLVKLWQQELIKRAKVNH